MVVEQGVQLFFMIIILRLGFRLRFEGTEIVDIYWQNKVYIICSLNNLYELSTMASSSSKSVSSHPPYKQSFILN